MQDLPPNSRARREAELGYAEAELAYRRAKDTNADLAKEQERLAKEGVEGTDVVKDARENLQDAQDNLNDAVEDGTEAIQDATRAHKELQEELKNNSSAIGGVQTAYDKLTPSQKTFVDFLRDLKPLMADLKEEVAKGFLPKLQEAITTIITNGFPVFKKGLGEVGDALGDASINFADAFKDQKNLELLGKFFTNSSGLIEKFGTLANTAFGGLLATLNILNPIANRFVDWLTTGLQTFEKYAKSPKGEAEMREFFDNAGTMAGRFGDIFGNVFGGLGKIVNDAFQEGSGADILLDWFERASENFANMDTGKLQNTLQGAAENTTRILDALTGVFAIFMDLSDNPGISEFWSNLELSSAAFSKLLEESTKVAPSFGRLLADMIELAALLGDSGQAKAFFDTLSNIAGALVEMLKPLKPILDFLGPIIGTISAATFAFGLMGTALLVIVGLSSKFLGFLGGLVPGMAGAGAAGAAGAAGTSAFATGLRLVSGALFASPLGPLLLLAAGITGLIGVMSAFKADRMEKATLGVTTALRDGADASETWKSSILGLPDGPLKNQISDIKDIKKAFENSAPAFKTYGTAVGTMATTSSGYIRGYGQSVKAGVDTAKEAFQGYGRSLANLAVQDMPAAQVAFKDFADQSALNTDQLFTLIDGSQEYRDELIKQAEQYGINVHGMDGVIDKQALVDFAMGTGEIAVRKQKEEMQKAHDAQVEYIQGMTDSAVANSGFVDSLKDAFKDGEFSSKKFFKNLEDRASEAAELVAVKTSLLARGATQEMLNMVDSAGKDALQVGRDLLKSNETDWNKWKDQTTQIAFLQSKEFADALATRQPLITNIFNSMGEEASTKFTNQLSKASTLEEFNRIAKTWETKLSNIKPNIDVRISSADAPPGALRGFLNSLSFMKDGGLAGTLQRFAPGGYVSGPGGPRSDSIFAMLSNGEYVINPKSTSKFLPLLEAINNGQFSTGGAGNTPPSTAMPSVSGSRGDMSDVTINVYPSAGMNESELATKISKVLALQLRKGAIT